jgi:hypothetical protein
VSKFRDLSEKKNAMHKAAGTRRLLWLLFEVGIGLLVVWICLLLTDNPELLFPVKWLGFAASTLVLFGYPIYWARKELAIRSFWFYWLSFLCLHLIVVGFAVHLAYKIPLILFAVAGVAEAALMNPVFIKVQMREHMKKQPIKANLFVK